MAAHTWDGVICLGDFLDLEMISRWNVDKPRKLEGKRVKHAIDIGRFVLERRTNLLRLGPNGNPDCRYIYIQGNHEFRAEAILDQQPWWEGIIDLQGALNLAQLGVEWVPNWSDPRKAFRKGKATFIHGMYLNQYHAAKTVSRFGTNVFYGDTHTVQEHALVQGNGANAIVGKSLGCLCDPKQMEYIRGKPQNWVQACSTFFFLPDGNFTEYTSKIFHHRFVSPEGVLFDGNLIPDDHINRLFIS